MNILKKKITNYMEDIHKNNTKYTVSLHIRRGDYLKLQHLHRVLTLEYYKKAIKYFTSEHTFVIFSDDIEWCKSNIGSYFKYVEYIQDEDYVELFLMSKCQHNIIANSSFSWWGAYLNTYKKKITIAPKKWFGPKGFKNVDDLFLKNWILIDETENDNTDDCQKEGNNSKTEYCDNKDKSENIILQQ